MAGIAVSILNHGAAEATLKCVASLRKAAEGVPDSCPIHIRVLDNGSDAADRETLERGLSVLGRIPFEAVPENAGFAAGHNHNLRVLLDQAEPEFVWLLNNDCVLGPDCIDALLTCARDNPDTAIWGATLLEEDGQTVQCAGGCHYSSWLSSYRQFGNGQRLAGLGKLPQPSFDYIAGASLFMPASTLRDGLLPAPRHPADAWMDEGTWLNEAFFLYFEELDLSRRLRPGLQLGWCRNALIVHASARKSPREEARAEYHSNLSALKFTWLHHRSRLWLTAPARFLLKGAWSLVRAKWRLLPPMYGAYRDFRSWRRRAQL